MVAARHATVTSLLGQRVVGMALCGVCLLPFRPLPAVTHFCVFGRGMVSHAGRPAGKEPVRAGEVVRGGNDGLRLSIELCLNVRVVLCVYVSCSSVWSIVLV